MKRECRAALGIGDSYYPCEVEAPHVGVAHRNSEVKASWCSDLEARHAQSRTRGKARRRRSPHPVTEAEWDAWKARHNERWLA